MGNLKEKKVLMFSPHGYTKHYGVAIKEELEKRGASVVEYDERPSQGTFMKIIIRLLKKSVPQIFGQYISNIIQENKHKSYDYILICRGEAFTQYTIKLLREAFPNAKIILYLWDVMHECAMDDVLSACDKVMSFDPEDAKKHNIEFRPTFFVNDYLKVKQLNDFKYDLSFIGTLYPPRHKRIKFLESVFKHQGIRFFSYLYVSGFIMYMKEFIWHFPFYSIRKVRFDSISLEGTIGILDECKCILDLNPPYQTSMSTRAHEAMAAKRKYITTNNHIRDYEYYNPNNIFILDINNPIIPKEFINSPFQEIDSHIVYKYSVSGLVDDLFKGIA